MRMAATVACGLVVFMLAPRTEAKDLGDYALDVRDYVLSPADWDRKDWALAGGALAAVGIAYTQDERVRNHFAPVDATPHGDPHGLRDAAPFAALSLGALALGRIKDDPHLASTGSNMIEAFALATASSFALKHAFGRERPDSTSDHGKWRTSGDSFPSGHVSAAFAAAQVLAESRPEGEWSWRVAAYTLGALTAYARVDGNMHWLSDTVAGAALGMATGHFVSQRDRDSTSNSASHFSVQPVKGGALLSIAIDPYELMGR